MRKNKWISGAIPALLIHCSIGTVYCWSIFSQEIAEYIGFSKSAVEWAFSFAIFFLGMSAAFLGRIVERDIKKSSLVAGVMFALGMLGTGIFIWYGGCHPGSIVALVGIYISYGLIMGIGLGLGYLSPVKALMLWFKDHKGLATGLAVAGFGAAKAIASPVMSTLMDKFGLCLLFVILAVVYAVTMFLGHLLLSKPDDWTEPVKVESCYNIIKQNPIKYFAIWIMFYINITCGLAIISQEKQLLGQVGFPYISLVLALAAVTNAVGRLGFSMWSDSFKDRNTIFKIIFLLSIVSTAIAFTYPSATTYIAMLLIVNACYGGGFSNIPTLLHDHYGMKRISSLHGLTLSAWAVAGLSGNQLATTIISLGADYCIVIKIVCLLYVFGLLINWLLIKKI